MSAYNSRQGRPNVTQFLRELQAPTQPPSPEDNLLEDDLAMFTNAQFNEWESSATDMEAPVKLVTDAHKPVADGMDASASAVSGSIGLDFAFPVGGQ